MPASLMCLSIRGIRSYSPREDREQMIEFMPLTLILGKNGTGKTTIIESLKFVISGSEPPNSDSRRNFIHDLQGDRMAGINIHEYASIQIQFRDSHGNVCLAKRIIAKAGAGKTATPAVTSSYKIGPKSWVQVHRQDDWSTIVPRLFGLPNQAILGSVILCHQEDNLWCMGDSIAVKLVFDKIFGCEQYKKEMKYIDDELRDSRREQLLLQKDLDNLRFKVLRKEEIIQKIESLETELRKMSTNSLGVTSELEAMVAKRDDLRKIIDKHERKTREIERLKRRINELTEKIEDLKNSVQSFTIKRPAPVAPVQQPVKKPTPDSTAVDLESIIEDLERMLSVIESMPKCDDLTELEDLVRGTLEKSKKALSRFKTKKDEPTPVPIMVPEEDDIMLRVKKFREQAELKIEMNSSELAETREKLSTLDHDGQLDDTKLVTHERELEKLEAEIISIRDQRSRMTGSRMQVEREIADLNQELARYKRINFLYSESLGKLVCNRIILEDLEKLKVCFQESIIAFHEQMIIKINELLRRRWKLIYQGSDIEFIELVDEEITRGKDKKSYNYYMAMRKNGKRMKMREKSSAGQRALAAIILRMTLAELFVKDFAFIALDEPTANLDLANVQALAKSIGAYVRKRKKLGITVQWIIITHDEQFLQALDEECSPYFYRTQLDPTDKSSNIMKISCHESNYLSKNSADTD